MKLKEEIFADILGEMLDTYKKKNHDYSVNGKSSFEKGFENFGLTSFAIRLGDKADRLTDLQIFPKQDTCKFPTNV